MMGAYGSFFQLDVSTVGQLCPRELVLAAPILQVALEALIHLLDANAGAAQAGRVF